MADKLNVVVICGSLRKGSFNAALARALPALAPPEMTLTPAPSFAGFPLYNDDVRVESGRAGRCRSLGGGDPRRRRRHHRVAGI